MMMPMPRYDVHIEDCIDAMQSLPAGSVQTCVTSPPYFGLRDYGHEGQIGLERSPQSYIDRMVDVFRKVWRVLAEDGTLWLNIGDTMNNRRRIRATSHQPSLNSIGEASWAEATSMGLTRLAVPDWGMKEKDTMGIPWALAAALRDDGWYLRQEIIWAKNHGKPEPSKDRVPYRHENLFLLSKSKKYYFDKNSLPDFARSSVWVVAPSGSRDHGASFPPRFVEPCVLAGSRKGDTVLDPFGGSGTTAGVALAKGRNAILCEINSEYAQLIPDRVDRIKARYGVSPTDDIDDLLGDLPADLEDVL